METFFPLIFVESTHKNRIEALKRLSRTLELALRTQKTAGGLDPIIEDACILVS